MPPAFLTSMCPWSYRRRFPMATKQRPRRGLGHWNGKLRPGKEHFRRSSIGETPVLPPLFLLSPSSSSLLLHRPHGNPRVMPPEEELFVWPRLFRVGHRTSLTNGWTSERECIYCASYCAKPDSCCAEPEQKGNSNMEFIQQQIASAMTNGAVAFTKLWS